MRWQFAVKLTRPLTLDRIFSSEDFRSETFGPARWLDDGSSYTTLEPSPNNKEARDIIRYEAATRRPQCLNLVCLAYATRNVDATWRFDDYSWSQDGRKLLVFTNTQRVWRQNTRGDYWVFEIAAKKLTKLGQGAAASTLMFAKFSPDGALVGYVRENNIYVEDLAGNRITQLTGDGSKRIINGTFDWVYEEELDLRDGWRWSPDGRTSLTGNRTPMVSLTSS